MLRWESTFSQSHSNMKLLLSLAFTACIALSQSYNLGGGPIGTFLTDPCTGGSNIIPAANTTAVATYTAEYQTFRWGEGITCNLPVTGPGTLTLEDIEPTVTSPGARLFALTINGTTQTPIDIFSQCGANHPCTQSYHVVAPQGVQVTCHATIRNCLLSALVWVPDPPTQPAGLKIQVDGVDVGTRGVLNFVHGNGIVLIASDTGTTIQVQAVLDTAFVKPADLQVCMQPQPVNGADCSGLMYVKVTTPTGVVEEVVGVNMPGFTLMPGFWSQVQ